MSQQHELQPLNQPQQQQLYPPQQASTSQGQHISFHPQQQVYPPPQNPGYPPQQQQVYYAPPQQQQAPYNSTVAPNPTNPMAYADPEDPQNATSFSFSDESIRKAFIRKVFSILSVQLAITTAVISLFVFHEPTIKWVLANVWIYYVSIAALLVTMIALACCEGLRRKSPVNFILLAIFTACMSLVLGVTCAFFETWEVMLAVGITVVVTVSLVIFALQTKIDFTVMGGVLFVAIIVLILLSVFALIFPSRVLTIVYASIGALLFCIYLVYDVQLMMGGKHKYSLSPEEYIFAALSLYIDIVNIFMYILMIIGESRSKLSIIHF